MKESFRTRCERIGFNFFPAYWCTGGRISFIAADWREVHVRLPLSLRTRNYVGTIFGGSLYSAVDPIYMIMLIKILGPKYIVWDKAASVRFRRPGRETLYATFKVTPEQSAEIVNRLESEPSVEIKFEVELKDKQGTVHTQVEKLLYIKKKKDDSGKTGAES